MKIILIAFGIAIVLFVITLLWNKFFGNRAIYRTIKKYFKSDQEAEVLEKYKEISKIVEDTEREMERSIQKKVKLVKNQFKKAERELIEKGTMQYSMFSSNLSSAMPESEQQLTQDMEDLKGTISLLESMDEAAIKGSKKEVGIGLGMFYDKMSTRIKKIIEEKTLDKFDFIPLPRLKYHAFQEIKNIKDEDFLPIIQVMRETNLLGDIIEINPAFHILLFKDKKLDLTKTEKVVLTFAYEEDNLTRKKLLELTEWNTNYAEKILNGLSEKGVLDFNGSIIIKSFNPPEERKKWKELLNNIKKEQRKREEEKFQKALIRRTEFKDKLTKTELIAKAEENKITGKTEKEKNTKSEKKIKFGKKPTTKALPELKSTKQEEKIKKIQDIKDKDSLIGAMEALDEELKISSKKKLKTDSSEDDLSDISLDIENLREEAPGAEDIISGQILNYDEKFSMINGGFVQYQKIKDYILKKDERVTEEMLKKVLNDLTNLKMINKIIIIGEDTFYAFNQIDLTQNQKEFIRFLINKKPMQKEKIIAGLKWEEEKVLNVMKSLQKKNILRFQDDKILIPGALQK
ncbi:MAG: hypothetical protein EU543_04715 [Promethearchaeota archaeon]|nr:MAG: hypothetical protein EU543_04715 [Candidatus Lokiarchaeota archaeon]